MGAAQLISSVNANEVLYPIKEKTIQICRRAGPRHSITLLFFDLDVLKGKYQNPSVPLSLSTGIQGLYQLDRTTVA